jgi:hypothetical protein
MTEGGEGTIGRKHSPETIQKIIKNRKNISGKNSPMYGKRRSAETIEKIRKSSLGRKHDKASSQKMREKALGRKHSPETKAKIAQANANRPIKKWLLLFPTLNLFYKLCTSIPSSLEA